MRWGPRGAWGRGVPRSTSPEEDFLGRIQEGRAPRRLQGAGRGGVSQGHSRQRPSPCPIPQDLRRSGLSEAILAEVWRPAFTPHRWGTVHTGKGLQEAQARVCLPLVGGGGCGAAASLLPDHPDHLPLPCGLDSRPPRPPLPGPVHMAETPCLSWVRVWAGWRGPAVSPGCSQARTAVCRARERKGPFRVPHGRQASPQKACGHWPGCIRLDSGSQKLGIDSRRGRCRRPQRAPSASRLTSELITSELCLLCVKWAKRLKVTQFSSSVLAFLCCLIRRGPQNTAVGRDP